MLVAALLVILLLAAASASADIRNWSAEPSPSRVGNVLGSPGVDVSDISVANVVNSDSVLDALRKLYGADLDTPEGGELSDFLDKAVAYQFMRIHHAVKSEMKKETKDG